SVHSFPARRSSDLASHVLLRSAPAFCHCCGKPVATEVGTGRIWLSVSALAYVRLTSTRLNNWMSPPNSTSLDTSGRSSGLPSVWGESDPPEPISYVSYCAT